MCSVLAATAGIILSAYVGYVDPKIGGNYNLESIAAAVLGGVAFTGGQGERSVRSPAPSSCSPC